MEGKYNVILNTSTREIKGTLILNVTGNMVSGYINAMGKSNPFYGGRIKREQIEFSGQISYIMMNIQYHVQAIIKEGKISGIAKTNFGDFNISGKKID